VGKSTEAVVVSDVNFKNKGISNEPAPFQIQIAIKGVAPLMMHRYDISAVDAKSAAPKGSKQKKVDNVESYLYRLPNGECCIPGLMFKACLCESSKFNRDPRSPRKSAYDLFRAGVICSTDASLGVSTYDYLDVRPVVVQMNRVARTRPAFNVGWKLSFMVEIILPEYITPELLNEVTVRAGRLCGLGDFRPDFGRFMVENFQELSTD